MTETVAPLARLSAGSTLMWGGNIGGTGGAGIGKKS